ncbi:uncharacterized protein EDB93DRAFT_1101052 [Suillus bovinus]|uniref:uncharacterized protein n=1 Tax=Suillus bovinus TaxID=48563 RepID=UPI001B86EB73|nr:uncharacterized protein EDB93DRAFT_1101052 [Suillus bovinus]KAG2157724.1 hypothetical protein EDB93DRAFT_1101052 [Suillus bovinus]
MRVFVLSCAIAPILSLSGAAAVITGAQRLARGLPPSLPTFGCALPGYAMTPAEAGGHQSPLSTSYETFTGRILVKTYDGGQLGHLYDWESGINGVNFGVPSEDLQVSFTTSQSDDGLIDLQIVVWSPLFFYFLKFTQFWQDSAYPGPGYIGTTSSDTLATGSYTTVGFGRVIKTPVHSPPVPVGQYNADESAIWTFDLITRELKVHYVNPDGHEAKTTIAYKISDNSIFFVGDLDAYNAVNPDILASPITFYFD